MTSSEFSVEGTASVKEPELDAKAVRKAREAFHSHTGGTLEVAIRAYLAAAPSRDQVSMGALREGDLFEAIRTIIYKRVSSQVDTHFIDRIHLVGVPDAAAEVTELVLSALPPAQPAVNALKAVRPIIAQLIADQYNVDTWGLKQRLAAIDASLSHPSSLVPTAEQGVAQLGGAPDDLRNLIKVVFAGLSMEQMAKVCAEVLARRDPSLATPPIAGAGEEPVAWQYRWRSPGGETWTDWVSIDRDPSDDPRLATPIESAPAAEVKALPDAVRAEDWENAAHELFWAQDKATLFYQLKSLADQHKNARCDEVRS